MLTGFDAFREVPSALFTGLRHGRDGPRLREPLATRVKRTRLYSERSITRDRRNYPFAPLKR